MSADLATEWLRQIGAILPTEPDLLLTSEEHAALNEHLARIGWDRQAAIARSGWWPVGDVPGEATT